MTDLTHDEILDQHGVCMIFGDIDIAMSEKVTKFILAKHMHASFTEKIVLLINSSGGSLSDAFAIIDIMKQSRIPVHTQAFGEIASSALMIFMAGTKGHRDISPNTAILSHQWSTELSGKYFEIEHSKAEIDNTKQRVLDHYKTCSGLDEKTILKKLLPPHDVSLTPEQAIKYGLADRIMQ